MAIAPRGNFFHIWYVKVAMKKIYLLISISLLGTLSSTAQSLAINTDGSTANASAILDIKSSTKGMLIPRLSTAQRTSIVSPAEGLLVFDSTGNSFWYYDGAAWQEVVAGNNTLWKKSGNDIYNINSGNVGIGLLNPKSLLQVKNGAVLFDSTIGSTPVSGAGTRLMWIPAKGALRAGKVTGAFWDDMNIGVNSIGLGYNPRATGLFSIAIGSDAYALADQAISIGSSTAAVYRSTAFGAGCTASGTDAVVMGYGCTAFGQSSLAMGSYSGAYGFSSFAIGDTVYATGDNAIAMGNKSRASGNFSIAVGDSSVSNGIASLASGHKSMASGNYSIAQGYKATASDVTAIALGDSVFSNGISSFSSGYHTNAGGDYAFASGFITSAGGSASTAMGNGTTASGTNSTAMGEATMAIGFNSTALGFNTKATATGSTAIGNTSTASGAGSIVLGGGLTASGSYSVAVGNSNTTSGDYSFSAGAFNKSSGLNSSSFGYSTRSKSYSDFSIGTYNDSTNAPNAITFNSLNRIFEIGNGTADNARSNAMTILFNGNTGIGSLNPRHTLEVAKSICVDNDDANNGDTSNTLRFGAYYTGEAIGSKRTLGGNHFGLDFYTNYLNRMVITWGGNIGMGVYSPSRALSVGTDIAVDENNGNNGTIANSLHFGASNSGEAIASNRSGGNLWGLDFYTNSVNRLSISNSGNVGIGTTAPAAALDVNGTTTTNGLQVSNGTVFTKMQSGSVTVGSNGSSQLIYTIVFPVSFTSSLPRVFVTARNEPSSSFTDAFSVSVRAVSATSVTLNIQRTDANTGWGQQLRLDWFAVE